MHQHIDRQAKWVAEERGGERGGQQKEFNEMNGASKCCV